MAVLKCKMCGGTLEINEGMSVCECEYCGTKQTITTANDENIQALFNRANILRMKSEFDKAEALYEKLVQKSPDDAEAHWGLILCKFGIEYVEDPATFKRVPTCHRTSFDSIIADEDYKEALRCADTVQRSIYEAEAKEIDRLQKEILALSAKEEPYDVFICYKESDNGTRTPDSVIANDIYHQLTNESFKVFYAAITLEDKLGSAYEPCIFAALNSAKVMLAIGTKPEYFNAVWVKNEWSRYLKMMKKDRSKLLIPCYKDMDAYELPEEFAHLQAQDMSKIGFINDIVRGIKKVIVKDEPKPAAKAAPAVPSGNPTVNSLLKRAFIFLEDGDWASADEYCEKVLDLDPENAEAYLGKLMAELNVKKRENLKNCAQPFDGSGNYQKVMRYADDALKAEMESCIQYIKDRNHKAYQESVYQKALAVYQNMSSTKEQVTAAKDQFKSISGYKDADDYVQGYDDRIKEIDYKKAVSIYNDPSSTKEQISEAKKIFESISGYKDADEYVHGYDDRIREIDYQKALSIYNNSNSTKAQITTAKTLFEAVLGYKDSSDYINKCIEKIHEFDYQEAVKLSSSRKAAQAAFKKAITLFEATDGYKDSAEQIVRCRESIEYLDNLEIYNSASKLLCSAQSDYKNGIDNSNPDHISSAIMELSGAIEKFVQIKSFNDSLQCLADSEKLMAEYEQARIKITAENQAAEITAAKAAKKKKVITISVISVMLVSIVSVLLVVFVIIPESNYNKAVSLFDSGKYAEAADAFANLGDYKDSADRVIESNNNKKYSEATQCFENGEYETAADMFDSLGDFKDSSEKVRESKYKDADKLFKNKEYEKAIAIYTELGDYSDSAQKAKDANNINEYSKANEYMKAEKYEDASAIYKTLGDYKDSKALYQESSSKNYYTKAKSSVSANNYSDAISALSNLRSVGGKEYDDEADKLYYELAKKQYDGKNYENSKNALSKIKNTKIIDNNFTNNLDSAIKKQKEEAEYKKRMEEAKETYSSLNYLRNGYISYDEIEKIDECLSKLPDDYEDVKEFKKGYEFYKSYLGKYTDKYGYKHELYMHESETEGKMILKDSYTSDIKFIYPSLEINYRVANYTEYRSLIYPNKIRAYIYFDYSITSDSTYTITQE